MLLHIDASRHAWIPDGLQDLVSVSDDATNELYYARLVPEETTRTVLEALRAVVATQGRFCALYTDRASHFIHTPKPEQPQRRTQVERALEQLGIELIAAHSPQARGRKERLYGTLQGRWPQELRVAGVTTMAAANAWLTREGIARYNRRFAVPAPHAGTAFVLAPADLDHIFSVQQTRVVSNANTVQLGRRVFQILPSRLRCHFVRCHVTVHEHLDGTYSITYGPHLIGRYAADGQPLPLPTAA